MKLFGIWFVDLRAETIVLLLVPWVLLAELMSAVGVPAFAAQPG